MTVGERIKQKRLEKGMSVDELAAKLGKNRATIYRYESNDIENLPISILGPISEALNVSPTYLMGYEDEPSPKTKKTKDTASFDVEALYKAIYLTPSEEGSTKNICGEDLVKALKLYQQYQKSIPQVQNAVDALLKPSQSDP